MSVFDKIDDVLKEIDRIKILIDQGLCRAKEKDDIEELAIRTTDLFTNDVMKRKAEKLKSQLSFKNVRKSTPFIPREEIGSLNKWAALLEEYKNQRKVKSELSSDKIHIQSTVDGEDQHIFISEKGSGEHAHLIVDGGTGEIRIDSEDKKPHGLIKTIQVQMELNTGERVLITQSSIKFM